MAQTLVAAYKTVDAEHYAHSFHSYFLRPGNMEKSITFTVDRIRDGKSFTTRSVKAIQDGEAIFNCSISFQKRENGLEHQIDMPNVPESYVHRIGRTARAGNDGIAISLCDGSEVPYLKDIEKLIQQKIPREKVMEDGTRKEVFYDPMEDNIDYSKPKGNKPNNSRNKKRSHRGKGSD